MISHAVRLPARFCLCLLALAACRLDPQPLPVVAPQASPVPTHAGLRAGFGRADITPPPGPGLTGNGPEGKRSRGWRTRLYARALYLEDSRGERLAWDDGWTPGSGNIARSRCRSFEAM